MVYILARLYTDQQWKCTMPTDELVSVADESVDVMLRAVLARRHFEYVRNAQQRLVGVTIYNNLRNTPNPFYLLDMRLAE